MNKKKIAIYYLICLIVSILTYFCLFVFNYRFNNLDEPGILNHILLIAYYPLITSVFYVYMIGWAVVAYLLIMSITNFLRKKDSFSTNGLVMAVAVMGILWNLFIYSRHLFDNLHQY